MFRRGAAGYFSIAAATSSSSEAFGELTIVMRLWRDKLPAGNVLYVAPFPHFEGWMLQVPKGLLMDAVARCVFLVALGVSATIALEANAQNRPDDFSRRFENDRAGNFGPDARYVLPFDGSQQYEGSYFVRENQYYFIPRSGDNRRRAEPRRYTGGEFSHVEDLSIRLETLANDLCLDLHHNYSHNRGFRETYREAYRILKIAQDIHEANHRNDRKAIQRRVEGMDKLFHHIQEDVRTWTRHQHRPIGRTDMHTKLELTENTIHHLMYDVSARHDEHHHDHGGRPGGGPGQAPRPR